MGDISAGNMCHEYYLHVSENSPLIRKSSYPKVVGMHTPFFKGQSGAQTPPTNVRTTLSWSGCPSDKHLSFVCPVDGYSIRHPTSHAGLSAWASLALLLSWCHTQAQGILSSCSQGSDVDGPWELAMLTAGGDLWFLSPRKQSFSKADRKFPQHMFILARTLN